MSEVRKTSTMQELLVDLENTDIWPNDVKAKNINVVVQLGTVQFDIHGVHRTGEREIAFCCPVDLHLQALLEEYKAYKVREELSEIDWFEGFIDNLNDRTNRLKEELQSEV